MAKSDERAARNKRIAEEFERGVSGREIAASEGVSERMVWHILKQAGITERVSKPTPGKRIDTPLSSRHVRLGAKVIFFRQLDQKVTLEQMAAAAQMTAGRLSRIEKGTYDPTLSELAKLAAYMKISVPELVRIKDEEYE